MAEEKKIEQPKKKRKWISYTIDGVLGVLILFVLFIQIEMMVSKSKNRGVGSVFGTSIAYVLTDSMDVEPGTVLTYNSKTEKEGSDPKVLTYTVTDPIHMGNGVIISKLGGVSELKPFDAVTFHMSYQGSDVVVTHRFIEYDTSSSTLYLMGDNVCATFGRGTEPTCEEGGVRYSYDHAGDYNEVKWEDVVGKVSGNSKALGTAINITQQTWFVPVMVLVPLGIIAGVSGYDMIKESKREEKEEEAEIALALQNAGIDPTNEAEVLKFEEKERYKLEMRKTIEDEKEAEKKRLRAEIEKEKKRLKKEMADEAKKGEKK